MDIEFHADIYSDEAIVRYRVAKDSHDGDEINLKQVGRIDDPSTVSPNMRMWLHRGVLVHAGPPSL